jgi:hypothetical protein
MFNLELVKPTNAEHFKVGARILIDTYCKILTELDDEDVTHERETLWQLRCAKQLLRKAEEVISESKKGTLQ